MSTPVQPAPCPACGNAIPADSPGGWCPACLMDKLLGEGVQVDPSSADTVIHPNTPSSSARLVPHERPSDRIDRYKLLQEIGTGGFGSVWMAEQEEPVRRRVALKIIKLGMDTKNVIARFEAERQALAMMDHPNIAKVFDAGATATGRPYFVMELVRGIPITQYCDENNLPAPQRLSLFIAVCHAIQHAHQKGIIHRDIKPSNILVTLHDGVPVPKVIDFGIAKATDARLTDRTLFTELHAFVGTPAYMSPEQAEMSGLDIDTRADIYSLGVLLYELLSGRLPFDPKELLKAGLDEIRRTIREVEPPRPSTRLGTMTAAERTAIAKQRGLDPGQLSCLLRGDLDWIVMKTLEKDRTRRYDTANGLALDLQRYLTNEAVLARPPSTAYLIGKLIRRHKTAFAAACAVVLALIAGVAVSTWQALRATQAERTADEERTKAVTERDRALQAEKQANDQRKLAETARKEAEYNLYAGNMNLAQVAWEEGNIGRLRAILEETRSSPHRGFEWYYWQQQTHLELMTLRGHNGGVTSAAYSSDGRRIVTGSLGDLAKVWDAETGRELLALKGHLAVEISADGRRIATGSHDNTIKVWDADNGSEHRTLRGHANSIFTVAFSPDARRIVSGSQDKTAKVWDSETGRNLLTLKGHTASVHSAAFSPDGLKIATAGGDELVKLWDVQTGQKLREFKKEGTRRGVSFSPDGRRIISGSGRNSAIVWDTETGDIMLTLKGHESYVNSVAFSRDGKRIATASDDKTAKMWDAETGSELLTIKGHDQRVNSAAFSPDGRRIVTGGSDSTARVWDAETGRDVLSFKQSTNFVSSVTISSDGRWIAAGYYDGLAEVWDLKMRRKVVELKAHEKRIGSIASIQDGRRFVTGSDDRTAKVWDTATGKELITLKGHNGYVLSGALSPDGRLIATGAGEGEAKLWEVETGNEMRVFKRHARSVYAVAFASNRRFVVTGSDDKTAKIWDLATGRSLLTLVGHESRVTSVVVSPDSLRVLTASGDNTAKVWDALTGRELVTLKGHDDDVHFVAFSPDGRRVFTASSDKTARIWDPETGRELLTLKGHAAVFWSGIFSPDGRSIITGSVDGTARWWRAASHDEIERWQEEETAFKRRSSYESLNLFDTLIAQSDYKAAYQLAAKFSDTPQYNGSVPNFMAWEIATNKKIEPRDLALAEKLATRATEADKGKSPDYLDTLARVLFMRGRKEEAIKFQEQAVTVAEDRRKPGFQKTLDSYRQGILPKPD